LEGLTGAASEIHRYPGGCPARLGGRWQRYGELVFVEFRLCARIGSTVIEWPNVNRLLLRDGKAIERVTYFDPLAILPMLLLHPSIWWRWWRCRSMRKATVAHP
jgi:hypothetical protein